MICYPCSHLALLEKAFLGMMLGSSAFGRGILKSLKVKTAALSSDALHMVSGGDDKTVSLGGMGRREASDAGAGVFVLCMLHLQIGLSKFFFWQTITS